MVSTCAELNASKLDHNTRSPETYLHLTACDDGVMSDYREAIINGALFRLLRMPSKDWTDYAGAQVYGSLFNEGLVYAERKARQGDVRVSRKVAYGGVHKPYKFTRNRYSRR